MKTRIIALAVSALIAGNASAAKSERNREEGIGFGSGAVVGAIAGGPVGFIIGAATGGWVGGKFHRERVAKEELAARYEEADALANSLQAMVEDSEDEIKDLQFVLRRQEDTYRDALQEAFDVEVYFHTGESALTGAVAERVARLGKILQGFDDFAIVIEGHADPRGDETYNDQLSAERAAAVRDALIRAGLAGEKITTRASGERSATSADGDIDAMALERRVDVSIVYPLPRENRVARQ
jgi:outer membrane protein OmpA-like peptidoglycan-associated protein